MKKVLLGILLTVLPMSVFSQLKVNSDGNTLVGTKVSSTSVTPQLEIGKSASSGYNVGLLSCAKMTQSSGYTCGIYGVGGSAGQNYGVVGAISNSTTGVGVFGSASAFNAFGVSGLYAGYFYGPVYVYGTLTANNIVQQSDIRLKENISPLSQRENRVLDQVLNMNVIEYNYKKENPSINLPDTVSAEKAAKSAKITLNKKHIGLIAQELQKQFPELVDEGQDGYLGINYIELVPVLIRSIQELNEKVEQLEEKNLSYARTRSSAGNETNTSIKDARNILYQNNPNPFKAQTTIRFSLADNVQDASICIFDLSGKMLKKYPVSSGMESVSVTGYELGEGMFLYSLIVNGQEIDTKKMIISK